MNSRFCKGVGQSEPAAKVTTNRLVLVALTVCLLATACAWRPPAAIRKDRAAEQTVAALQQINAGLERFKCVGKVTLVGPDKPVQSHRAAIAGQFPDRLRIDMLAPFGGSSGTLASDGGHLVLVMPYSREYYKKRFGDGSLSRFIQLDISVDDLLELMVGRIPMDERYAGQLLRGEDKTTTQIELVDWRGRVRQRITVNEALQPINSVWYGASGSETYRVGFGGRQTVDGFALPRRIEIVAATGSAAAVSLDRCEVNPDLDTRLFSPARPVY